MTDRTSNVRVNVHADASGATSKLGGFVGILGKAALGIGGVALAAGIGGNALYEYGDKADDLNASIAQGIKTQDLYGKKAGEVADRVTDQAKAISEATAVDINSIKATQAKLLTFAEVAKSADKMGGNFDRATEAAVDMAAKGFGTAESNATQLGKALNDPVKGITALTRAGITFTEKEKEKIAAMVESGDALGAQSYVLSAIEKQVGGTAEVTAGGFEKMKNSVSIWGQELATKALPYLDQFGNFMLETGGPAIVQWAGAIGDKAIPMLQSLWGFISTKAIPVLSDLAGWVMDHVVPAYGTVLAGALEGAKGFFKNVSDAVDDNRGELGDLGEAVKKAAEYFTDNIAPVLGDFYKNILPAVGDAIGIAIGAIADIVNAFQTINDKVQTVIDKIIVLKNQLASLNGSAVKGAPGSTIDNTTPTGGQETSDGLRVAARGSAGGNHFHFHLDGHTFVGSEMELLDKFRQMAEDNGLRFNELVPS